jgi:hypothetical protein
MEQELEGRLMAMTFNLESDEEEDDANHGGRACHMLLTTS